jgi:hypothetical protein
MIVALRPRIVREPSGLPDAIPGAWRFSGAPLLAVRWSVLCPFQL